MPANSRSPRDELPVHVFSVEGTHGSGKSTLLARLAARVRAEHHHCCELDQSRRVLTRFVDEHFLDTTPPETAELRAQPWNTFERQAPWIEARERFLRVAAARLRKYARPYHAAGVIFCDRSMETPALSSKTDRDARLSADAASAARRRLLDECDVHSHTLVLRVDTPQLRARVRSRLEREPQRAAFDEGSNDHLERMQAQYATLAATLEDDALFDNTNTCAPLVDQSAPPVRGDALPQADTLRSDSRFDELVDQVLAYVRRKLAVDASTRFELELDAQSADE